MDAWQLLSRLVSYGWPLLLRHSELHAVIAALGQADQRAMLSEDAIG
jgi:hypothetical protein